MIRERIPATAAKIIIIVKNIPTSCITRSPIVNNDRVIFNRFQFIECKSKSHMNQTINKLC